MNKKLIIHLHHLSLSFYSITKMFYVLEEKRKLSKREPAQLTSNGYLDKLNFMNLKI